jgi:hypothetical protein
MMEATRLRFNSHQATLHKIKIRSFRVQRRKDGTMQGDRFVGDLPMVGSEGRIVLGTNLRAREGAIFVYAELPKWFFVAQLETLEVDDWGVKATVLPLPSLGLSCPPRTISVSGAWNILSLSERRWSAFYAGWSMYFGEELVVQVISHAAELAHLSLLERIPALVDSVSDCLRKSRWGTSPPSIDES